MIDAKLKELGLQLPAFTAPMFDYVPVTVQQLTAYVSGQIPRTPDGVLCTGKLGAEVSLEKGQEAARLCILHGLSALKHTVGSLDRIERILKVTGFVASANGFTQQPQVIDAASGLLKAVFGEIGRHARSAIGVAELPRGVPVEIEMIVALKA
jgi:enamine deaminase RidA (YjgF/YER057c/UK114 family)